MDVACRFSDAGSGYRALLPERTLCRLWHGVLLLVDDGVWLLEVENPPQPLSVEGGGIKSLLPSLNRERLGVGLLIIATIWAAIYWLLVTFTNSNVPLADSFTTALSIVGIWALAHKYLEQWFIWIVVDVVTSVLYFYKDIPFKASLYALYVIIAIFGYIKWRKMINIS